MADASAAEEQPGLPGPGQAQPQLGDPVSCVYVRFQGLRRASPHALIAECRALGNARTLGGVQAALRDAHTKLSELELFKSLRADVSLEPGGVVEVVFVAEERRRDCTVSANVDKRGEVCCDVRVTQPALLGGPLTAMGSIGCTASQAREFLVRLSTPRFLGRRCFWSLDVARSSTDESEASSCSERVTHAVARLSDSTGTHSLSAEAALRDLYPAAAGPRFPSAEVQQARFQSVKTSIRYSFSWAGLVFGAGDGGGSSAHLNGNVEAAGLLGDVHFVRCESHASTAFRLPWGLTWRITGSGGVLLPTDKRQTCLQDRFFLGGASGSSAMLKGFATRGVGPVGICHLRDPDKAAWRTTDALGGEALLNSFMALSAPVLLPRGPQGSAVQGHLFGFLGLGALAQSSRAWGLLESLRGGARACAGVGLGVPLGGLGSLELTLACPVWAQQHDVKQRWQLGLRLDSGG